MPSFAMNSVLINFSVCTEPTSTFHTMLSTSWHPRMSCQPATYGPACMPHTMHWWLSCVRRRWKQSVVLGSVVAAAAALCVWLFLPPAKPHAYTKLYFPTKPAGSIDHPDPPINQLTQKELVTSRIVLKAVVEDPAIASLSCIAEKGDPISWLLRDLAVDFPAGSEIMRLTLTDVRAEEAKTIIDKVAQVYMAKIGNERSIDPVQPKRSTQAGAATAGGLHALRAPVATTITIPGISCVI